MKILLVILIIVAVGLVVALFRMQDAQDTQTPPSNNNNAVRPIETDMIRVAAPLPNALVQSPINVRGEARGNWYFEASFPVRLIDANGNNVLLEPPFIMTTNDWMTTDFVPFQASISFSVPTTSAGILILQKDNPSGLPEFDDEVRIPVRFR